MCARCGVGQGDLTHFQDQEITVNANLTRTFAIERLRRAAARRS